MTLGQIREAIIRAKCSTGSFWAQSMRHWANLGNAGALMRLISRSS